MFNSSFHLQCTVFIQNSCHPSLYLEILPFCHKTYCPIELGSEALSSYFRKKLEYYPLVGKELREARRDNGSRANLKTVMTSGKIITFSSKFQKSYQSTRLYELPQSKKSKFLGIFNNQKYAFISTHTCFQSLFSYWFFDKDEFMIKILVQSHSCLPGLVLPSHFVLTL